ncbi:molecular chaperone DnaJ [soil metagenome]
MTKRDYYEILSVTKTSSGDEIKTSYRKLAMKYHPDKNPGDKQAEEKFKELAEAYEVLSDSNKRQRYDQFGHQGVNMGGGAQGFENVNDIFSHFGDIFGGGGGGSIFDEFFGGGQRRGRQRQQGTPGSDLKINLELTLEEISEGVEKVLKVKKYVSCQTCSGTGAKNADAFVTCSQCNGSGEIRQVSRSVFGQFVNVAACPSCHGEGRIIKEKCEDCRGEGRLRKDEEVNIKVPSGVKDGNYIPLEGQGNAGIRGGQPGDLLIYLEEKEHDHFIRDEDDIIFDLDLSFIDAALGADVVVPTLKGKAKLEIEQGTQSGRILKMKNKGIKRLHSESRGDQLVRVNLYTPVKLTSKEKEILKQLKLSENFSPNIQKKKKEEKSFFKGVFN